MIIFESGGIKNLILIILVILFTGIIAWQWIASDPFASIEQETDNIFLTEVTGETGKSFGNIKNSVDQGTEEMKTLGEDIAKQAKQEQLIEEAKKYLEDKEAGNLKSPSNQDECNIQEGEWNEDTSICYLATSDSDLECNNSSECQGYCVVDLSEVYDKFITDGQSIEISGSCSENVFKYGCLAIVEDGQVNEIVCLD